MKTSNTQKGFTLIELLVVIAIIGILSSIVLASLTSARAKARDARRLSDLKQIRTAIEMYINDNNHLPRETLDKSNGKIGEGAGLDTLLAPYMQNIPHDPLGPGNSSYYYYYDGNQWCVGRANIAVLFARNMESSKDHNRSVCSAWGGEGGAGAPGTWNIIIGDSDG